MSRKKDQFVTSKMVEGITGFNLCAFLIGLEGWRRGLKLNYYVDIHQYSDIRTQGKKLIGRNYSFSSKDRTHYFNQSRGDKVCNEAVRIAQSKQLTKQYLKESGANILDSLQFDKSVANEEIIEKSKTLGYPLIVKPTYGTLSKGVVINIKNDEELKEALKRVRNKLGFKNVIVEQYFNGDDIRLYVIEDKVVAGIKRVPAKVAGDGVSTIKELIDQKNESRKSNPYLAARPIKIDDEVYEVLQEQGYSLDSVLEKDKIINVKYKSTLTQGVDLYDITDEVPENIKRMGINTLKALPNIPHGSIDMLYDGENAVVLEVNASANISMHMFPTAGTPRHIGGHLMDYYFPETKPYAGKYSNFYFDYVDIVNTLERNYTNYIEVKSLEVNEEIISKRLILTGKVKNVGFKKWAKKKAIVHNIDGHIKDHSKNSLEIIAAGPSEDVMQFIKSCKKGPKKAKVKNVEELDWDKEIMLGFKAFTKNTINYEKYYKKLSQKLDSTIKEYEELEKQYNKLLEDYQKQKNKGGLQFFKKVSRLLKK